MNLFVVMAETGEYEQRSEWVAGVYTVRADAEKIMAEKFASSEAYRIAYDDWCKRREPLAWNASRSKFGVPTDEAEAAIVAQIGPMPDGSGWEADRFCIIEVPMNVWGHYYAEYS